MDNKLEKATDERLVKALEFSRYMVTLNNQKRIAYEKFLENCVYYQHGGKFSINVDLINFLNTLTSKDIDTFVLIDDNKTPINIDDISSFADEVMDIYFTQLNEYLQEYERLRSNRSVEGLLDI